MKELIELIQVTVEDLAFQFIHHDRDGDDELPPGIIQAAIEEGAITPEQLVRWFANSLRVELEEP